MGCRLLWWVQAMLLGSLKQGVQAMLLGSLKQGVQAALENRIWVAAESVPFSFGGSGRADPNKTSRTLT